MPQDLAVASPGIKDDFFFLVNIQPIETIVLIGLS